MYLMQPLYQEVSGRGVRQKNPMLLALPKVDRGSTIRLIEVLADNLLLGLYLGSFLSLLITLPILIVLNISGSPRHPNSTWIRYCK